MGSPTPESNEHPGKIRISFSASTPLAGLSRGGKELGCTGHWDANLKSGYLDYDHQT